MFCPKCGSEIPEGYEFCMKCGTKAVLEQPSNEVTKVDDKSKKFLPFLIIGIVVVAAILFIITSGGSAAEKKGLFKGVEWESDTATAMKKLNKALPKIDFKESDNGIIGIDEEYKGKEGVSLGYMLTFKGSGKTLSEVSLIYTVSDDSKYTSDDVYEDAVKEYTKLYGKPDTDKGYQVEWETEESEVEISHVMDGLVMQSFKPLN
jgi:hypothetical protein